MRDNYDDNDGPHFANPGSNSALRASSKRNPRNRACPTCKRKNLLTREDILLGYQCDRCADALENGRELEF